MARRRRGGGDGGRELELDFERVLDASQALERQLDPALHAVELLRKEKERLERELERDYKTLQNLEAGARGQSRQQREQLKKAHVLTPHATTSRAGDDVELAFDDEGPVPPGALFKVSLCHCSMSCKQKRHVGNLTEPFRICKAKRRSRNWRFSLEAT